MREGQSREGIKLRREGCTGDRGMTSVLPGPRGLKQKVGGEARRGERGPRGQNHKKQPAAPSPSSLD